MSADTRCFAVKADAFFVRHDDGVWLRNDHGSFSIRGKGAYELVETVFAHLDGERSVADLCAGLPDGPSRSVARLIDTLAGNGFLKRVEHPVEHAPDWMRERYPAHLAFLDHHADRPVTRMTRVRTRPVLVGGSGVALRAALDALAEFGIATARIVSTDPEAAVVVAEAAERDPHLAWTLDHADLAAFAEFPDTDEVVLAVDDADPAALADLQWRLRATGSPVAVLATVSGYLVAAAPPSGVDWCWECVHRSVVAAPVGGATGLAPAATPAALAALHVAQHVFARLAEVDLDGAGLLTSAEPLAPVVRTHTGRRHPMCRRHGAATAAVVERVEPVRPDVPAPQDPPRLTAVSDRIVGATAGWTDQVVGPLLSLGEGEADQLPLSASTCLIADPVERASRLLVCRAVSPREARNQVVLAALEWTAGRLADHGVGPADAAWGAGWTSAEAWYRAVAAASLALPPASLSWQSAEPHGADPVHGFLTDTLAAEGRPWTATALEALPTGLHRARVRTADFEVAEGVGIDAAHAVGNALLRAVAGRGDAVAHLAPPVATWPEAVAAVRAQGRPPEPADVTHLLPFLGDAACLAAIPGGAR
uniref:NocH n=1 Tax=Nocardia sp. ATCC 202099 TaxID=930400 RepID=E5DUI0_9NOCA|nr:NocH [Nocardia sp. ATCC 202099]